MTALGVRCSPLHERSTAEKITPNQAGRFANTGLTLVEVLVAAIVLSIAAIFAASMTGISVDFLRRSRENTGIDIAIDRDFSELELAGFQYTYCTGSYTWDGRECAGAFPGVQNYYFPLTTSSSTSAADQFGDDCSDGTMTDALRSAMNGGDSSLALSDEARALGISRQVTQADGTPKPHRLIITYLRGGGVIREKVLIPPAYYWCPDTEAL